MSGVDVTSVTWTTVCAVGQLQPGRGAAALLADGTQVAVFLLDDGSVHAVDQRDPYSEANVMARGLVGSRGDRDVVVSPMLKQAFDLRSGAAIDDPAVRLRVFPARQRDGRVEVGSPATTTGGTP